MEIEIKTKDRMHRCFKLNNSTLEELPHEIIQLILWAKSALDIQINASYNINNELKYKNETVINEKRTELTIRYLNNECDNNIRSEIIVNVGNPIYCVYHNSYIELYNQADFNKEFIEEKTNSKTGLTFEQALTLLKSGKEVRRLAWEKDIKLSHTYLDGHNNSYIPVIYLYISNVMNMEWKPQHVDLFATDWMEVCEVN